MIRLKLYTLAALFSVSLLLTTGCGGDKTLDSDPYRVQVKLEQPIFRNNWAGTPIQKVYGSEKPIMKFILPLPIFFDGFNITKNSDGNIVRDYQMVIFYNDSSTYPYYSPSLNFWDYGYYKSEVINNDEPLTLGRFEIDVGLYVEDDFHRDVWKSRGSLNLKQYSRYKELQLQRGKIYDIILDLDAWDIDLIDFIYEGFEVTPKTR